MCDCRVVFIGFWLGRGAPPMWGAVGGPGPGPTGTLLIIERGPSVDRGTGVDPTWGLGLTSLALCPLAPRGAGGRGELRDR